MGRPASIQWNVKQWLGDNKVLAMDWDARAMHFHLLMLSIQENPQGSIPDDMDAIRRWLGSPSGSVDADQAWRRVRPQIFAAWSLRENRWFNDGMVRECERQDRYRDRYENGTRNVRESTKKTGEALGVVSKVLEVSNSKSKPASKTKLNFSLPDWIPKEIWAEFEEMRKKSRKPMTDRARSMIVKDLDAFRTRGHGPETVLAKSIRRGWTDVYEPTENGNGSTHGSTQEAIARATQGLYGSDDSDLGGGLLKLSAKGKP